MTHKEFFSLAKTKGIDKIQITEETKKENSVYYINSKLEDYTDNEKITYAIKAEKKGKTEYAYTEYLDEVIIDLLLEKFDTTESNYKDEYLIGKQEKKVNEKAFISIDNEINAIKKVSKLAQKNQNIKSIEIAYGYIYTKTRIVNNLGTDITTTSHNQELYIEASAAKDDIISTYSDKILASTKNEIQFEKIATQVLDLASIGVEKKKLETKKYNIVLSNKVVGSIISNLATMLSAAEIHQKKSCLENKLQKLVFSNKLTILEMPNEKKFPGYTIFDKEGTKTIDKEIIKDGIIKTYLYDIKESKIENKLSTGNKYNEISARNMYIVPGNKELEELFEEMKDGIYITSYMGSMGTSVNCGSGNISMQIFGYIIENGKIKCGFEPAIMTTTIFELLTNIKNIGSDLKFTSKIAGGPSLYIEDISIASE